MKRLILLLVLVSFYETGITNAQNLYNLSNSASIENEANSVDGWSGAASVTSDSSTFQHGSYSLRIAVQGTGREARFSFTAQIGSIYNISIWARRTANSNNPAFANWLGLQGFTTTVIASQVWTQYNFTVTATLTTPTIRVYAGPIGSATGIEVFIDAISILPQTPPDSEPPTAPTNLMVSNITESTAEINWSPSVDNIGVVSYSIIENSNVLITLPAPTTSYSLINLLPGSTHYYTAVASDAANNTSDASDTLIVVTLLPPPDTIKPSSPTNLIATNVQSTSLTLNWNPSTDNIGISHYIITQDSTIIDSSYNGTSFIVVDLQPETTYSFFITAVDVSGNISNPGDTLTVVTLAAGQMINYTSDNANLPTINWQSNNLYAAGNAGIGTVPHNDYRLSVNGAIRSKEVIVESGWSDFVFEPGYKLSSLQEVEQYILAHGHLENIPSSSEVELNGIGLSKISTLLLQKIEELTLYLIILEKRLNQLESQKGTINQY